MAIAKKCDICGRLYEYNSENFGTNGFRFVSISCDGTIRHPEPAYDCCPRCFKSIKTHIEELKGRKE